MVVVLSVSISAKRFAIPNNSPSCPLIPWTPVKYLKYLYFRKGRNTASQQWGTFLGEISRNMKLPSLVFVLQTSAIKLLLVNLPLILLLLNSAFSDKSINHCVFCLPNTVSAILCLQVPSLKQTLLIHRVVIHHLHT